MELTLEVDLLVDVRVAVWDTVLEVTVRWWLPLGASLLLVVRPRAPSSFLFLVARPAPFGSRPGGH